MNSKGWRRLVTGGQWPQLAEFDTAVNSYHADAELVYRICFPSLSTVITMSV